MKKNKSRYINIVICIIFGIVCFIKNTLFKNADDEVYKKVFYDIPTFFKWTVEFYKTWSGRIIPSAMSNIFLRMPDIVFKISNSIVFVLMVYSMYLIIIKLAKCKNGWRRNIILLSLFSLVMIINKEVIENAVIWVTGSFNYLWPLMFMMISLIPYINEFNGIKNKKGYFVIYFTANLIGCFGEQPAAILFVFASIVMVSSLKKHKGKVDRVLLINYIFITMCVLIGFLAPGNRVRMFAVTLARNPYFEMVSLCDKIFDGIVLLLNHLLGSCEIFLIIISILLLILNIRNKKIINIFVSCFTTIYTIIILYCNYKFSINSNYNTYMILFEKFNIEYIYSFNLYIPIIIGSINMLLLTWLIVFSVGDIKRGIQMGLFILAGMASVIVLCVSPTMPWPGDRVFFVADILLIFEIGGLIAENLNVKQSVLNEKAHREGQLGSKDGE